MKNYHFERIYLVLGLLYVAYVLGMAIGLILSIMGFSLILVYVSFVIGMMVRPLTYLVDTWHQRKIGSEYGSPRSPEGLPVDPSGIRLEDDTILQAGSLVLVLSDGLWYRAVVVEIMPRDRVLIHFLGWDAFWDEVHPQQVAIVRG